MPRSRPGPVGRYLDTASPEALFVLSGVAQYVGAAIAISVFDEVSPATVAWLRMVGGAAPLLIISRRDHRRWSGDDLAVAAIFGVATAMMNMFFYLGIDRLPLGSGVAIEFIGPVTLAAARTRTARNAVALALAACGVAVLGGIEFGGERLGLLFIGLASAMWAVYIVAGSRVAQLDRGMAGLGVGLAIGAVALAPIGLPTSGPVWSSGGLLAACLLTGVFSSAIAYGIDQHTMRRVPVRRFSVLSALLPITALVIAFLALDQRPTRLELVGIALVVGGVVAQERDERPAPAEVA